MMGSIRGVVGAAQPLIPESSVGGVVLCYHLVDAGTDSPVDIPDSLFRDHMETLAEVADVVTLDGLVAGLPGDGSAIENRVVITFDDAFKNFFTTAWPVMYGLELPVTLYVPVGFLNGESPSPMSGGEDLGAATWEELREGVQSGLLTIGSHSWTHPDIRTLDRLSEESELGDSRRVLEDRLGIPVSSFCYPRGMWDEKSERMVGKYYDTAVVGGGSRVTRKNYRPLRIPRIPIRRDARHGVEAMLRARVWLEEWLADWARRMLR